MLIILKNKHTLQVDDFYFRCTIGKNGLGTKKIEEDKKTPIGTFKIDKLFYRKDRTNISKLNIKSVPIKAEMGWCDDINNPKNYNKLININKNIRYEALYRKDFKYDLLIPIKYNYNNTIIGKGSCIFIHLTKNYKTTAGCIALQKKDFLIMLKLINTNTKIKIY